MIEMQKKNRLEWWGGVGGNWGGVKWFLELFYSNVLAIKIRLANTVAVFICWHVLQLFPDCWTFSCFCDATVIFKLLALRVIMCNQTQQDHKSSLGVAESQMAILEKWEMSKYVMKEKHTVFKIWLNCSSLSKLDYLKMLFEVVFSVTSLTDAYCVLTRHTKCSLSKKTPDTSFLLKGVERKVGGLKKELS